MTTWMMWLLFGAAILHVLEEYAGNWVQWASDFVPGITWRQFWVINALLFLVCGLGAVVPSNTFRLSIAALELVNIPFHLLPALRFRRYSPGLASALTLYAPCSVLAYLHAFQVAAMSPNRIVAATLLGIGWMAVPLLFQAFRLSKQNSK